MDKDVRTRAYPLLGSIQNSVGFGFLGNEAVTAIAHRMRVRTSSVMTGYASARGGLEGRMVLPIEAREFRRGIEFLIATDPAVLVVGFLPRPEHVGIVAAALVDYHGLVVLDPVLGSYEKGLYVSAETARQIRDDLLPHAQVVTPNRFEAEVLLDLARDRSATERTFLDRFSQLGPETVIITSFVRDPEKRKGVTLFSNGYAYERIFSPLHTALPAHGAGDTFSGAIAVLLANNASPLAATLHATALTSLSVERATGYGAGSVDPVAALDVFKPMPYLADEAAMKYAERFGVTHARIPAAEGEGARLTFAPPHNQITY
ncbi:MAG: pyridoxal kinase PdxY [Candidatus Velthaea sp.]